MLYTDKNEYDKAYNKWFKDGIILSALVMLQFVPGLILGLTGYKTVFGILMITGFTTLFIQYFVIFSMRPTFDWKKDWENFKRSLKRNKYSSVV